MSLVVNCIECGAEVKQGTVRRVMCWDCRSRSFSESPNVLTDGEWFNDGGIQRWRPSGVYADGGGVTGALRGNA